MAALALDIQKPAFDQFGKMAARRGRRDIRDVRKFACGQRDSAHQA
jgi:hypothetical protein